MKQKTDETAMEFLRRVVHNMDYEYEYLLDDLKSVDAILDYAALWSVYDTDFFAGIQESIEEGADAKPFIDFCKKYNLSWWKDWTDVEPYDDGQPDEAQEWHDYDPDC